MDKVQMLATLFSDMFEERKQTLEIQKEILEVLKEIRDNKKTKENVTEKTIAIDEVKFKAVEQEEIKVTEEIKEQEELLVKEEVYYDSEKQKIKTREFLKQRGYDLINDFELCAVMMQEEMFSLDEKIDTRRKFTYEDREDNSTAIADIFINKIDKDNFYKYQDNASESVQVINNETEVYITQRNAQIKENLKELRKKGVPEEDMFYIEGYYNKEITQGGEIYFSSVSAYTLLERKAFKKSIELKVHEDDLYLLNEVGPQKIRIVCTNKNNRDSQLIIDDMVSVLPKDPNDSLYRGFTVYYKTEGLGRKVTMMDVINEPRTTIKYKENKEESIKEIGQKQIETLEKHIEILKNQETETNDENDDFPLDDEEELESDDDFPFDTKKEVSEKQLIEQEMAKHILRDNLSEKEVKQLKEIINEDDDDDFPLDDKETETESDDFLSMLNNSEEEIIEEETEEEPKKEVENKPSFKLEFKGSKSQKEIEDKEKENIKKLSELLIFNKHLFDDKMLKEEQIIELIEISKKEVLENNPLGKITLNSFFSEMLFRESYLNIKIDEYKTRIPNFGIQKESLIVNMRKLLIDPIIESYNKNAKKIIEKNKTEIENSVITNKKIEEGQKLLKTQGVAEPIFTNLKDRALEVAIKNFKARGLTPEGEVTMGNGTFKLLKDDFIENQNLEKLFRIEYLKDTTYELSGKKKNVKKGTKGGYVSEEALIGENVIIFPEIGGKPAVNVRQKSIVADNVILPLQIEAKSYQKMIKQKVYDTPIYLDLEDDYPYKLENYNLRVHTARK